MSPDPASTVRLVSQIEFLLELDKAKSIVRRSYVTDGSRRENDAEHMWHLALFVLVLAEHADEPLDVVRVLKMVLVHDIVEIDAGDTFLYDDDLRVSKVERELAAAERLYGLLPDDQAAELREIWDEFEAKASPEARFAASIDRLQPVLLNLATEGRTWREHGLTADRVRQANAGIADGSRRLGRYVTERLDAAVAAGHLSEAPPD